MTDSYAINGLTLVVGLVAAGLAFDGVGELAVAIGFPPQLASVVGLLAGASAFVAVLYCYYLLFLRHTDGPAEEHRPTSTATATAPDSYVLNTLTIVIGLFGTSLAWTCVAELLIAIGLPPVFGSFVGFCAGVGAFFAVLYGYYLLFLEGEDQRRRPEPGADGATDSDVVGVRSYRK